MDAIKPLVNQLQALNTRASGTKIDALDELYEQISRSRPPWHRADARLVVDAGGIPPLVESLQQKDCRRKAAQCLTIILEEYWACEYGNGAQDAIVAEGAMPPLVSMLRSREITSGAPSYEGAAIAGEPEKRAAAEALTWLVRGHEGEAVRAGVLDACVAIMQEKRNGIRVGNCNEKWEGQCFTPVIHAVWVLYYLADVSHENRRAIMEAGGMFLCLIKLAENNILSSEELEDLLFIFSPEWLVSRVSSLKRKLSRREGTRHDDDTENSDDDDEWVRSAWYETDDSDSDFDPDPGEEDDDDSMTLSQVRALELENASLKAELARVKDQESITRLELLLDRTDAWKRHEHSKGVIAFGFGLGALRGRATTLTDATLDPRMKPILDAVLDVGRRGIAKAEWRYVQTIYLMKNNRRGVHTDARNIGLSHIISFGDYSDAEDPTAGRLSTNNGILNTYRQMCSFYAQDHHAVLRYDDKGTRYTVAYFRTLRDYSEDLREKLNSHGFGLLPAVKRQEICHICEEDTKDSRDRILLCDGSHGQCTAEVHLKCLEPGRSPDDAWFCKFCREASPTSDDPVDNCRVDMTETAGKRIQESLDATPDKRKKRFKRDPG